MCHLPALKKEVDALHDRWMLDLTFRSLFPLLSHWGEQYDELEVICDESKPLYAVKNVMANFVNRQERVYVPTYGGSRKPLLVTPGLASPIRFANSKGCHGLQIADLVAGTMRHLFGSPPNEATRPWRELMSESVNCVVLFDPDNLDMRSRETCVNAVVLRELIDRTLAGSSLTDGIAEFAKHAAMVVTNG